MFTYLLSTHVSPNINSKIKDNNIAVVEVGMHTATQCIMAARAGFQAHCIEPSPVSFQRVQDDLTRETDVGVTDRITLYNVAAGSNADSGKSIPFISTGGTGDHAGTLDMWSMKEFNTSLPAKTTKKTQTIIQVP